MKKRLIALLFSIINPVQGYTCEKLIPKNAETIVMVDLNFVWGEVKSAKKAACEKGKNFKVLPYGFKRHKKIGLLREKHYRAESYFNNRDCFYKDLYSSEGAECLTLSEKRDSAYDEVDNELAKILKEKVRGNTSLLQRIKEDYNLPKDAKDEDLDFIIEDLDGSLLEGYGEGFLEDEIKHLADSNIKPSSVIISGHDGGGSLYGMAGSTYKEGFLKTLKDSYKDKEDLLSSLESIYLWGCYTATRGETNWWNLNMPQLKVIAGFQGTGPSIGKEASNSILFDLIMSEDDLFMTLNAKEMESKFKNLDGFNYLLSGIYSRTCNENEFYIGRNEEWDDENNRTYYKVDFGSAGSQRCKGEEVKKKLKENYEIFMKYYTGDEPIPEDTQNGPLRTVYNTARAYSDCLMFGESPEYKLDPNQVALLLFYKNVKKNIYKSFGSYIDELKESFAELAAIESKLNASFDSGAPSFFEEGNIPEDVKELFISNQLSATERDLKRFKELLKQNKELIEGLPGSEDDFMKLSRKEISEIGSKLNGIVGGKYGYVKPVQDKIGKIKSVERAINIYSHYLDTKCMDWISWHDYFEEFDVYAQRIVPYVNDGMLDKSCKVDN